MMDQLHCGILQLIRCAITGDTEPFPADFDWEAAYPVVQRHKVHPLVYFGAVRCGVSRQHPVMQKLFRDYCTAMVHSEQQMKAVGQLCQAFEQAGIDYMPLKGSVLKSLYPQPEMRIMGDADILIRVEQYDRIVPIAEKLGFEMKCESDHELIWQSKALYLELHKRLIPSYNPGYHAYFADCWGMAVRVGDTFRHALAPEDEFVYLFTHFAKHYRDGGIGLRHLTDLWVYQRSNPGLDEKKILRALRSLQLDEFYANVMATVQACFNAGKASDVTDFILETIFDNGLFGTKETHRLASNLRYSGGRAVRRRNLMRVVFPPREALQYRFPVLKRQSWLLPFVWVYRGITVLLFRRRNLSGQMDTIRQIEPEKVDAYRRSLQYVGLRFESMED